MRRWKDACHETCVLYRMQAKLQGQCVTQFCEIDCFANPPLRLCDDNATSSDFRLYRVATRKRQSCHLSQCGSLSSSCLAIVSRRAKGVTLGDHRWTHRTQPTSPSTTTKYRDQHCRICEWMEPSTEISVRMNNHTSWATRLARSSLPTIYLLAMYNYTSPCCFYFSLGRGF